MQKQLAIFLNLLDIYQSQKLSCNFVLLLVISDDEAFTYKAACKCLTICSLGKNMNVSFNMRTFGGSIWKFCHFRIPTSSNFESAQYLEDRKATFRCF